MTELSDNRGMSYHTTKEKNLGADGCCDFGDEDPYEALKNASAFLDTPSPEAEPAFVAPQTPLVFSPSYTPPFSPDPEMQLSDHFKLKDLIVTSLPYSNLPDTQEDLDNLVKMATLLEAIRNNIGTYTIASVYRSQANQDALRKSNTMAVKKSYHSLGLACDLTPTNGMSTQQFAKALYRNPVTNVLLGQIVDKGDGGQTSVHLSLPTSKFPQATPMHVGAGDAYFRILGKDLESWEVPKSSSVAPLMTMTTPTGAAIALEPDTDEASYAFDPANAISDDEMNDDSFQMPWVWIGGGLAAAAAAFFFYKKRKG